MKFAVFGLSITSAWGNGHATLLRGLFRALYAQGHEIHFFEKDVPYYAQHRDASSFPYVHLHLYDEWQNAALAARRLLQNADVGIVTSYCSNGSQAADLLSECNVPQAVFYDMDTPVTLERLARGETIDYLPSGGLSMFNLVLSYTGGATLTELKNKLNARAVAPLYGWVDPDFHCRQDALDLYRSDIAYLGTYAADRHDALNRLMLEPARNLPECLFLVAGAMYPDCDSWPENVRRIDHVAPPEHGRFYSSSPLMLSVTRSAMAANGFCPSGRLFESAACGTAVLSDWWEGLDSFFVPGEEILVANSTADSMRTILQGRDALEKVGQRARERTLDCHTAALRARTLVNLIEHGSDDDAITNAVPAVVSA